MARKEEACRVKRRKKRRAGSPSPQRQYQIAHKHMGLCVLCPEPAVRWDRCRIHAARAEAYNAQRALKHKGVGHGTTR